MNEERAMRERKMKNNSLNIFGKWEYEKESGRISVKTRGRKKEDKCIVYVNILSLSE